MEVGFLLSEVNQEDNYYTMDDVANMELLINWTNIILSF